VGTVLPADKAQTLTVTAAATRDYYAASASVTINVTQAPPNVTPAVVSTRIDDGTAQPSMVRSLTLIFNGSIASMLPTVMANLSLVRASDGLSVGLQEKLDSSGTVLTLTFTGASIIGTSLADGRYTLTYAGATVLSSAQLWRLFGDQYGMASVTAADQKAFMAAYRSRRGQANYNAYFDFDANGTIDTSDYYQFLRREGTSI
jgi:hypothetical protein